MTERSISSREEIVEQARELLAIWDENRGGTVTIADAYSDARGPAIWALTHHITELTRTVMEIAAADRIHTAIPLIRLSIECAMTCAWLLVTPGSGDGFMHEGFRQRHNTIKSMVERDSPSLDTALLDRVKADFDKWIGLGTAEGQRLEQRFKALNGGAGVYTTYRVASGMSHAGATLASAYMRQVERTQDAPLGIELVPDLKFEAPDAWLGIQICMLLTAMNTFDRTLQQPAHEKDFAEISGRLGVAQDFQRVSSI